LAAKLTALLTAESGFIFLQLRSTFCLDFAVDNDIRLCEQCETPTALTTFGAKSQQPKLLWLLATPSQDMWKLFHIIKIPLFLNHDFSLALFILGRVKVQNCVIFSIFNEQLQGNISYYLIMSIEKRQNWRFLLFLPNLASFLNLS